MWHINHKYKLCLIFYIKINHEKKPYFYNFLFKIKLWADFRGISCVLFSLIIFAKIWILGRCASLGWILIKPTFQRFWISFIFNPIWGLNINYYVIKISLLNDIFIIWVWPMWAKFSVRESVLTLIHGTYSVATFFHKLF